MNRAGIIRCSTAAVLFGISAPLASLLTNDMGAFTLAGLLYVGAAIAVIPFVGRTPPSSSAIRASLPNLSMAVILGGAVGPVLLAAGLGLLPAATSSLLLNLELVFTVIVASVIFREHLGRNVIVGTALVIAGTIVLTWSGSPDLRWGALLIAEAIGRRMESWLTAPSCVGRGRVAGRTPPRTGDARVPGSAPADA
jgi:drug/metabolite transporter (DMT)-like permease